MEDGSMQARIVRPVAVGSFDHRAGACLRRPQPRILFVDPAAVVASLDRGVGARGHWASSLSRGSCARARMSLGPATFSRLVRYRRSTIWKVLRRMAALPCRAGQLRSRPAGALSGCTRESP
jgi:hypothetical protein